MSVSLYDLSVASHLQILGGVANVLAKGEDYAATGNMDLQYLGLLQRWVTQQVTDQQFRLETEATVSMMLAGIAKKPADRKHWHDQFIRTQARLLKVSTLDQ